MTRFGTAASPAVSVGAVGLARRRSLFERLGRAVRVAEITAPAGSGKTSLLRSWVREMGLTGSTAWVSVQREESDSQRFWISILDALRHTAAGSARVRRLTAAPDLDCWAIVERLLDDLALLEDRVWLVIDDLHELRSGEALRQLELLVMRAPEELRFVLSSRQDLPLRLHRLRLEDDLTEIRTAQLGFTFDEARALFDAAGVEVSESALALLVDRTEGWAVGLRLAALSVAGHPDPERLAAEFSGSERTVAEYFLAEVLDRQPDEVKRLLVRTSVLERVSGPLADALTGGSGGERSLQELEEAGAFVVSLDAQRTWFRYHHLFADLLQLELRRTAPDEVGPLHNAAAEWYAEHGFPIEAIRHAQTGADWSAAARLLSDHWFGIYLAGEAAIAHELLARFPAGAVAADAELAAVAAADELNRGSLEEAERYLALAAQGSASVLAERRERFQVMLAHLRLSLARQRGNLPAVVEEAQRLLAPAESAQAAQFGFGDDLRALVLVTLGTAEIWAAQVELGERHLEWGVALARRIERPYLEVLGLAHMAIVGTMRSVPLAERCGIQAIELARRHGWSEEPVVAVADLALAVTRIWQGRLEEAEPWLERAERALRAEVEPATGLMVHLARGLLELGRGRDEAALAALRAAERPAELLVDAFTAPTGALLLQTLARQGETERVETALAELGDQDHETGEIRITLAALRLAQDDSLGATAALAPVLDGSAHVVNPGFSLTQAFVLEAIARHALGDGSPPSALSSARSS